MRIRLRCISLGGMLFCSAILMQGCTVLAWLGIVCEDVVHCSDVEFESFEEVWVAPPEKRQQVPLEHIVVTPFLGNDRMAEWWASVVGQATDRHVISPTEVTSYVPPDALTRLAQSTVDRDYVTLAPEISRYIQVDAVFFGRVVAEPPEKAFWGLKERYAQRLYLHLVSPEGTLLWKGELPFAVVKGKREIDEAMVKRNLLTHVTTHANELGWTNLGLVAAHKSASG